jgi:peroxiredoxin
LRQSELGKIIINNGDLGMNRILTAIIGAGLALSACDQKPQPVPDGTTTDIETAAELEANGTIDADTELELTPEQIMNDPNSSLTLKLEAIKNRSLAKMPADKKADYDEGIQALISSGQMDDILKEGNEAPNFTAMNTKGEEVSLFSELKEKPVVLVWYRGGWCPYCNMTLQEYARYNNQFEEEGYQVIAISPEKVDKAYTTSDDLGLPFEVLSDNGNTAAEKFGLKFELTGKVKKWYDKSFGMQSFNGDDSGTLPIAGTYVIDTDGIIRNASFLPDYRLRVDPRDVLEFIRAI